MMPGAESIPSPISHGYFLEVLPALLGQIPADVRINIVSGDGAYGPKPVT